MTSRRVSVLGLVGIASLVSLAPGCHEFDTERQTPKRGSVGQEMFGVICDRVAAQVLREDLTGDSFRNVCHKPPSGDFADEVDVSKLPPITAATDANGKSVSTEKQREARDHALARVAALARRRPDLIRAFDAAIPEEKIPTKDLDNADPAKSCSATRGGGEGLLTDALADMLGRMGPLYVDGTLPHSTQGLARIVDEFKKNEEAQAAWARIGSRQGYRPIDTALGALRPIVSYPGLRDFSNASLRLLSADSQPYDPSPRFDADGNRIPVAGPANEALNKLLETAHEELLTATPDKKLPPLVVRFDPNLGRPILSRPRDNIELMQEVLLQQDDAFSVGSPHFIARRDSRGYAAIRGGSVPEPFLDENKDGLPDVDALGRFKTANGSVPPAPFSFPNAPQAQRDKFGRATFGNDLLYDYIDTSRTFAAQTMKDLKPLVNSDPEAKHETVMYLLGGLPVMMGPRETRAKEYATGKTVLYDGIRTKESPMLDFVYALGVLLGDRYNDQTLTMTKQLFTTEAKSMARVTAAMSAAYDVGAKHPEAKIPTTSTFWDEKLDVMAKMAADPILMKAVLEALANPATQKLGFAFSKLASFKDEMTYDKNDVQRPGTFNVTKNAKVEMSTPVDRNAPITGLNRSALSRFLALVSDTAGVTACNKPDAHLTDPLFGREIPLISFKECEVFKIDNLGAFYLDSIVNAQQYNANAKVPKGTIYLRPGIIQSFLRQEFITIANVLGDSSGLSLELDIGGQKDRTGFWPSGKNIVAPKPHFLNRLVFFDFEADTKNSKTKSFILSLQGDHIGTSVCPARTIDDPIPYENDEDTPDSPKSGKIGGLRDCQPGQWLQDRGKNTIFTLEEFGFYEAVTPLISAFVQYGKEDLFLELSAAISKHWPGPDASDAECALPDGKKCTKEGMNSYEALLAEALSGDVLPAIGELVNTLTTMSIKTCDVALPASGECPAEAVKFVSGIDVLVNATRAAVDPKYSKDTLKLVDRNGAVTARRNDGSTNPQITPIYLLTNALHGVDLAFDKYEEQNPSDKDRRANWRRARSQLVDQFLGTTGTKPNFAFANPSIPKMTPVMIDMLRGQLWAHCPKSFVPPYERCAWARDELIKKATDALAGPLATTGIDVMDALARDPDSRRETMKMMEYLVDAKSENAALASMLASATDISQLLRDDENLLPLFKVLAAAVDGSKYDKKGRLVERSLVDSQMALLARLSGRYFTKEGTEICKNEMDPNQVLSKVLAKLVTPIDDKDFNGHTPLEIIIDVAADVNRADPSEPYDGTLAQKDYASVSTHVVDFLSDKQKGLEQFYEVIRNGVKAVP